MPLASKSKYRLLLVSMVSVASFLKAKLTRLECSLVEISPKIKSLTVKEFVAASYSRVILTVRYVSHVVVKTMPWPNWIGCPVFKVIFEAKVRFMKTTTDKSPRVKNLPRLLFLGQNFSIRTKVIIN